jgi:Flavin containing amine oxidoreductase
MDASYVIVGGGVSGLYAAYRCLQQDPNCKVTIIEKLNKLGGRIMTETIDNHVLEYGPMRFEPDLQKTFAALLEELEIDVKNFPPYTCPAAPPDFNQISFEEISAIQIYKDLPPAFALLKHGLCKILGTQWDLDNDHIDHATRDERKSWLKQNGMYMGRHLYEYGLWDILSMVLSKPAVDYIQHKGSFYHMITLNPNASDQICFMLDILATATTHLITMKNGSYTIIERLLDKINSYGKERCNIILDANVIKISEYFGGEISVRYMCKPNNVYDVRCDHLILTCQKKAYATILFDFIENDTYNDLYSLIDSVLTVYLYKIFVVIENPPFNKFTVPKPNFNATKIPCREIHYYYDEDTTTGMVMIYGDLPSLNYWANMKSSEYMNEHLLTYLQQVLNDNRFTIKTVRLIDWGKEPYKSGVHLWKPGCVSEKVMNKLAFFGSYKNIHICGETFSNYQGFIEGSLRTVDNILRQILQ